MKDLLFGQDGQPGAGTLLHLVTVRQIIDRLWLNILGKVVDPLLAATLESDFLGIKIVGIPLTISVTVGHVSPCKLNQYIKLIYL